MANVTWNGVWTAGNTTLLRATGAALRTMFETMGFVRTADTGQIDWTTVNSGGATNDVKGYEVWRFDDALQATRPVFFKVQYVNGISYGSGYALRVLIEFGTASNGSGTLSGLGSGTSYRISNPNQNVGSTDLFYAAGDGSGMAAHLNTGIDNVGNAYNRASFVIDRLRSSDGTPIGDGVFFWSRGMGVPTDNNLGTSCVVFDYVQNRVMAPSGSSFCFPVIPALISGAEWIDTDSAVSFYPLCVATPTVRYVKMMVAHNYADIGWSPSAGPTIQHLGAARQYRLLRWGHYGAGVDWASGTPLSAAFWWSD